VDGRNLLVVRIVYGDLEQEGRFDPLYNYGVVVSPSDTEEFLGCLRLLAAELRNVIRALERLQLPRRCVSPSTHPLPHDE
jgi:hypothetical protein